jgi:hypothetical protein
MPDGMVRGRGILPGVVEVSGASLDGVKMSDKKRLEQLPMIGVRRDPMRIEPSDVLNDCLGT